MSDPLIGIPVIILVTYVIYELTYFTITKLKRDRLKREAAFHKLVDENIACLYPNSRVRVISTNWRNGTARLSVTLTALKNAKPHEVTLHVVPNPKRGKHPDEF